ncbi:L-2-hydroxyglutarate dehydrogenase [Escovopsis weberi]|uniref:L-2-hydroxyglutarate dehydrogenase, mitochondrial n=1 Tax=Escovopsis weberi TaxID=150374 RepID=A0A0M8N200_ESCWE|nr:L-2-hydroxyglutarate dehydrogenase [Escovopsis weberi]
MVGDAAPKVIGGGVVGLAIARQLAQRPSVSVVLLERHAAVGTETSSRSSEVIHAGLYYPPKSLKTRLCVRGRGLLYALCARYGIGHRRTGKWIVAQTDAQRESLERIFRACGQLEAGGQQRGGFGFGFGLRWVSEAEVARDGEGVRAARGALESPETGIVDSHGVMACLAALFEERGGLIALKAPVAGVRPHGAGWQLDVGGPAARSSSSSSSSITAETIINAAGLGAVDVHNMIVPPARRKQLFYAKGNYFSYSAPRPRISRLIYPATAPGAGGLGTHLTLDLGGRMRFGPDVDWVDSPADLAPNPARLADAVAEIRKYLPGLDPAGLQLDYAGIRPKLAPRGGVAAGKGFQDFVIRREDGYEGWVNLLGIESPGLTSSLAIAEMVEELLYGSATST